MTLPSNVLETTQRDLEQLIVKQVQEGAHLEFKRDVPSDWNEKAKSEFLADASAFANAGGGDIVFGIEEDRKAAQANVLVPQKLESVDETVLRMQNFLRDLVEPRLPGAQIHSVPVKVEGVAGHAIVVRVPQSWAGPHRIKTNQHFYIREGGRKRQLDVPEIKGLFLRSDSQAQKIRGLPHRTAKQNHDW